MNLKWLFRVFTTKDWRGHKRKVFYETLLEDLREDRNDGIQYENFSFIKIANSSYKNSCHELAAAYDYNPVVDAYYEINLGKYFTMYHPQPFDSLYARIERKTSIWKIIIGKSAVYHVTIFGEEKEKTFKFSYRKFVKKVY